MLSENIVEIGSKKLSRGGVMSAHFYSQWGDNHCKLPAAYYLWIYK